MNNNTFSSEVKEGKRFTFGKNWKSFLETFSPERVKVAEDSLLSMLEVQDLKGKTFLDIGCGSGLFSLAACNLGATVYSFDYDPDSVQCAMTLRENFHQHSDWKITEGSVLDEDFLKSLGKFDIVYSWGVLHHTGNLNMAMKLVTLPVKSGGQLFIGLYNDQGRTSRRWKRIKQLYNKNLFGKSVVSSIFIPKIVLKYGLTDVLTLKNPAERYKQYKKNRGMSLYHDWIDWLGGYPYEVAKPALVVDFYKQYGFILTKITTTLGPGINEYVFLK